MPLLPAMTTSKNQVTKTIKNKVTKYNKKSTCNIQIIAFYQTNVFNKKIKNLNLTEEQVRFDIDGTKLFVVLFLCLQPLAIWKICR